MTYSKKDSSKFKMVLVVVITRDRLNSATITFLFNVIIEVKPSKCQFDKEFSQMNIPGFKRGITHKNWWSTQGPIFTDSLP